MAGIAVAVVGVAVAVIAVIAIRNPHTDGTEAGSTASSASHAATATGDTATASSSPNGPNSVPSSAAQSTPSSAPSTSASESANRKAPLVVLNNTTITGLARRASDTFTAGGWTVSSYGNYQNNILSTCAYYDPNVAGAKEAAGALKAQFPRIRRTKEQFDDLARFNSPIVVILTPDWSSE